MARQRGAIKLEGTVDELVFYLTKRGYLTRNKGTLDKTRVKKDPAFARSRKASTAFGQASRAGGLIRTAIGAPAKELAETDLAGKMLKLLFEIIKTDPNEDMGKKELQQGKLKLLEGFNWDSKRPLYMTLLGKYTIDVDRKHGQVTVHFPDLKAKRDLQAVNSATHAEIFLSAATVDFETKEAVSGYEASGAIALNGRGEGELTLTCNVGTAGALPIIVGLGVKFTMATNKKLYELRGGSFAIVRVA